MKTLPQVTPTAEQLRLISNPRPGVHLIRGAAGSGKTTTALLMLRLLAGFWTRRRSRHGLPGPTRVLALTFNRTLRGYIGELAESQIPGGTIVELSVSTFGKWSFDLCAGVDLLDHGERVRKLRSLVAGLPLDTEFALHEVDYVRGRFPPGSVDDYVMCRRERRGTTPRVPRALRRQLLDDVIHPYEQWKRRRAKLDWNDLAVRLQGAPVARPYDIIVADETQDFSANQVRAVMHFAASPSTVVFVLDSAQQIYPRSFTWREAGISRVRSYRLETNHRNTVEICRFASPLLEGLEIGDDGTFPDFNSCLRSGPRPHVLTGRYTDQVAYALDHIEGNIDLRTDSVAFLKPRGGGWFDHLKSALVRRSLRYVEITRQSEWSRGPENIALSTMHSAKGLEFDHVFVLGLNQQVTPHGAGEGDSVFENLRRVLAMAITRARCSVMLGYKPGEASTLIDLLDGSTYEENDL